MLVHCALPPSLSHSLTHTPSSFSTHSLLLRQVLSTVTQHSRMAVQAEVPYAACGGWLRSGCARGQGVASYPQPSTAILDMEFDMEEDLLATCECMCVFLCVFVCLCCVPNEEQRIHCPCTITRITYTHSRTHTHHYAHRCRTACVPVGLRRFTQHNTRLIGACA